jgi:DNA-binding transcriptional LysR family regulator
VRLPRGLQPTPLANELAPALLDGLTTIRGGLQRTRFDPTTSRRIFKIGMGDVAEVVHLPMLLRDVRASAPHIRLHTTQIAGSQLRDALGDGEVCMATGDYELGAGCRSVKLYEGEYACVVRPDHPLIGTRLTLRQFKAAEHILVSPKGAFPHAQNIERILTSRGISAHIVVQVSHFQAVMAMVCNTDLIATIPERLAQTMKQFANINVLPPPISLPRIQVSLYWHERFHREPGNSWLRNKYIDLFKM